MNVAELGLDVASLRAKAGLTQAELAQRAGTTQAVISRLENGLKLPGYQTLDDIASVVGTLDLVFGERTRLPSREERRRRVQRVLGSYVFDPWERDPTPAEARSLIADGLGREAFARD